MPGAHNRDRPGRRLPNPDKRDGERLRDNWVKVDITHRRLYIGVPMPTPNFWLPNAPVNAAPTSPNVILMCNFQGLDSGQELKSEPQMHTTMFGTLNAIDMRRKWSLWQIPAPYANFCAGVNDE